ncbi:MAG: GIY-YIG nuclease family protein [Rhodoplanes sp.]
MASRKNGTLYLGVTNNLVRRIYEHKSKAVPGFTARYNVDRLVWFECYDDPINAIEREKELKKWRRNWKIRLIEDDKSQPDRSLRRHCLLKLNGFRAPSLRSGPGMTD